MLIEKYSPAWVINKLESLNERLSGTIRKYPFWTQIILIAITFATSQYLAFKYARPSTSLLGRFIFRSYPQAAISILACALLPNPNWIKKPVFRILLSIFVMAVCLTWLREGAGRYYVASFDFLTCMLVIGIAFLGIPRLQRNMQPWSYCGLMALMLYSPGLVSYLVNILVGPHRIVGGMFFRPFKILFVVGPLFAMTLLGRRYRFWHVVSHGLSPIQIVCVTPLFQEFLGPEKISLREVQDRTRFAAFQFLSATTSALVAYGIYRIHPRLQGEVLSPSWIFNGWVTFIYYYFAWLCVFRLVAAAGSLLGYNLPDPSSHSLLAANPLERWRRWNSIYYDWSFRMVFLPIQRWTKSSLIGLFAVFFFLFLVHNVQPINFFTMANPNAALRYLTDEALFYSLHFLVVLFGFQTRIFWPSGESVRGWLGVGATHLLMALTHGVLNIR